MVNASAHRTSCVRLATSSARPVHLDGASSIDSVDEVYEQASVLSPRDEFRELGLTDTAILDASSRALVVTLDHALSGKIHALGGNVVNFHQLRSKYL